MLRTHGRAMSLDKALGSTGVALYQADRLRILVTTKQVYDKAYPVNVCITADKYVPWQVEHLTTNSVIGYLEYHYPGITRNGWKSAELYTV